jgi:hypothetical protein
MSEMTEAEVTALAEAIHDAGSYAEDGGVPDVCDKWPEHEALARAILATGLRVCTPDSQQDALIEHLAERNIYTAAIVAALGDER